MCDSEKLVKIFLNKCGIVFDDWNCYYADPRRGQRKAFSEFKQILEKKFYFEKFITIHTCGMSFICLDKEIGYDFL